MININFSLKDASGDNTIKPLLLKVNEQNNRVEVKLPDGQIVAFEQFLGQVRIIHWTEPNNDTIEPLVVPLR